MPSLEVPRFTLDVHPERSRVVLRVGGELDVATRAAFQDAVDELRRTGWGDVVVDPQDITFIDSAGLAALLDAAKRAEREGWRFALADGSAALERLLSLTSLGPRFERVAR